MIKSIKIDFPELGVKRDVEFTEGINLIEKPNGWGKSTLLNTILSFHTGKFGTKKIPTGTATMVTDQGTYLLSKGLWVGRTEEPNVLVRNVMPGAFFDLSTPDQRMAIVELLGIDRESFMKELIPEWTPDLKTELNKRMSLNAGREDVLLDDIMKLRSVVIVYEKNPVEIEDNTNQIIDAWNKLNDKYIKAHSELVRRNMDITLAIGERDRALARLRTDRETLLAKYKQAAIVDKCPTCHNPYSESSKNSVLDSIKIEGKKIAEEIKALEEKTFPNPEPVPPTIVRPELDVMAKEVGMELRITSEADWQRRQEYLSAKKTLAEKEEALRKLGEVKDKEVLAQIAKAEFAFTQFLEEKTKSLGLEIELFKTQKNGEIKESFLISKDEVPYSDLSNGNKVVLQFRLATAFAKLLGLDFVLLDEAGTISKESLEEIKKTDLQVIIARATPFTKKDLS